MIAHDPTLDRLIDLALAEDAPHGDVTTRACVPEGVWATARIVAKQACVLAGRRVFERVFERVDPEVSVRFGVRDGSLLSVGDVPVVMDGRAHSLLVGERVALNFLMRLTGIATSSRRMSDCVIGTSTRVVDTRKTTPGWRMLEKDAVLAGGAFNHRASLSDGVLIKDNHIAACGGITQAVERARERVHHLLRVEVEVESLRQLEEALACGADGVLLDNMDDDTLERSVAVVRTHVASSGRSVFTEASGNMTLERLPSVAATGVDFISVGGLTHSAPAADLSMKLSLDSPPQSSGQEDRS
jgi:nicotinate-nucleotide pyrophosphorylase (carboxylating)